jgi:hypothetical protein
VTVPFLPIDSTVVSNPDRMHLSIIESWMLWPDDEAKRLDAYKAAVVEIGRDLTHQIKLEPAILEDLFYLAADAKPLDQLRGMFMTPFQQGLMAGNILIAAVTGKDAKGGPLKLGDINEKLRKLFARGPNSNSSFVNTIWKQYRAVSHLWAAHIQVTEDRPAGASFVFPCELPEIIEFLWLSEQWRVKGESMKTAPRAPSTILRPGESVRIPDALKFSK